MSIRVLGPVFAEPKESSIRAIITRADGTVEDLGLIAYYHRNPVLNAAGNVWVKLRERLRNSKTKGN